MFEHKYDGTDDQIDSRDIVEKIEELISEFEVAVPEVEGEDYIDPRDCKMSEDDWKLGLSEDDAELLAALIAFREENDGRFGDSFEDGVFFIHEDYFTDAMQELCDSIGVVPADAPAWLVIDWAATADNLRADYTSVEFQGSTYWAR